MEKGYIRVYRTLMEKGYYSDSEYVHLWVHLLMNATYIRKEYLFNGKIEYLNPGQFITGRHILSKKTGIQESKVERILKSLEIEQQIEQQKNNKFRIITILNWSDYQQIEQQIEQPVNNQRTTSEQPVNTINKDNKYNKENNNKQKIEDMGDKKSTRFTTPDFEEVKSYCQERKNNINPEKWINHYESNGWMIGKNKMKNWKAAIRTWELNETIKNTKESEIDELWRKIESGEINSR